MSWFSSLVVLDDQDLLAHGFSNGDAAASGSCRVKRAPAPARLSTAMSPWKLRASARLIGRPSPVPCEPSARRLKKGSKIRSRSSGESHFAVGDIHYPNAPQPGVLIYIKASLVGDESSDVKEYAARHDKFPNESTGDQFFNETSLKATASWGGISG